MFQLFDYSLAYQTIGFVFLVAFFVGMAKTGVHGISLLAVPLLAVIFGGKASSGLMLPMLVVADLFAVKYYHRHANWSYLVKLFPSAIVGVLIGTWLGNIVDDEIFRVIMSVIIFVSLGIMLWMEKADKKSVPDYLWFAILMGLVGGVSTMIGNLAGPIMGLYLLSMRLPKNEYIGTAAWFFLVINVFKVPFHIYSWQSIDSNSLLLNLISLPFIAIGAVCGVYIVKRIPDRQYRWFVIGMTAIAAILMNI
ncbi:sulfite exporter TauE/SafE family protein [Paraglaciecola aquimarina]|uniref:Probable membrane transporter protein n=1 Tax=Paraglaciecola aquimarina TaxID=1235557 RepID=A0ABU3SWQ4_9ALTE|nr:sulfite exporter TauE/SafE family protein [Paraglaciecola aquimarina]MDU0354450.1 sulfite exporter TauE/SafE family protein [Paraglaciecola aquimarina]